MFFRCKVFQCLAREHLFNYRELSVPLGADTCQIGFVLLLFQACLVPIDAIFEKLGAIVIGPTTTCGCHHNEMGAVYRVEFG
jgi:hypothetical protein